MHAVYLFIKPVTKDLLMKRNAYLLGLDAGQRGLWFHETLNSYLSSGAITRDNTIEFYRGYWGDLFDVSYDGASYHLKNKK